MQEQTSSSEQPAPLSYRERLMLKRNGLIKDPPKEKKPLKPVSDKKAAQKAEEKKERGEGDSELQLFFKQAMKKMTGHCAECGARTETHVYQYAIYSICHILAKRPTICPSVAHDPNNWIELCPDHHNMFDAISWDERMTWGCWPEVLKKLILVAPNVDAAERRHVPEIVWKEIEKLKNKK